MFDWSLSTDTGAEALESFFVRQYVPLVQVFLLFDLYSSFEVPQNVIDIRNCMNLQKVHLPVIFRNYVALASLTSLMVQMLSQITCHSMQELVFKFRTPGTIVFDWTFVANALADPKFDCLQVIHVQADVHGTEDMMLSKRDAWQVAERLIRQGALLVFY